MWQKKLLPFTIFIIITVIVLFVTISIIQLNNLNEKIIKSPNATQQIEQLVNNKDSTAEMMDNQWKALVILENTSMEKRYHQANLLLMSRIWIKYLGFLTGVLLCIVGGAFVVSKYKTTENEVGAESFGGKYSLKSTSPGLVIAFLGTLIIIASILTNPSIEVRDAKTFMGDKDQPIPGVAQ